MICESENTNLAAPEDACPRCGERDIDHLVWIEDGQRVRCTTCCNVYMPPTSPGQQGGHDANTTQ